MRSSTKDKIKIGLATALAGFSLACNNLRYETDLETRIYQLQKQKLEEARVRKEEPRLEEKKFPIKRPYLLELTKPNHLDECLDKDENPYGLRIVYSSNLSIPVLTVNAPLSENLFFDFNLTNFSHWPQDDSHDLVLDYKTSTTRKLNLLGGGLSFRPYSDKKLDFLIGVGANYLESESETYVKVGPHPLRDFINWKQRDSNEGYELYFFLGTRWDIDNLGLNKYKLFPRNSKIYFALEYHDINDIDETALDGNDESGFGVGAGIEIPLGSSIVIPLGKR